MIRAKFFFFFNLMSENKRLMYEKKKKLEGTLSKCLIEMVSVVGKTINRLVFFPFLSTSLYFPVFFN